MMGMPLPKCKAKNPNSSALRRRLASLALRGPCGLALSRTLLAGQPVVRLALRRHLVLSSGARVHWTQPNDMRIDFTHITTTKT
jgi:hypothetical protein